MRKIRAFIAFILALALAGCSAEVAGTVTPEPENAPVADTQPEDTKEEQPDAPAADDQTENTKEEQPVENGLMALALAAYPETVRYPENEMSDDFMDRYQKWNEANRARWDYAGAWRGTEEFVRNTMGEFLRGDGTTNRLYSPLNVYMALAMLAEVTGGETRDEVLAVLGADSLDAVREKAAGMWLYNYRDDGAVTSLLGSSLWMQNGVDFNMDTVNALAERYYASVYAGDLQSEEAAGAYRAWLNEMTGGLLEDYVKDKSFPPETIMAIATTLYFRAKWASEFNKYATAPDVFHAAAGDETADFMHRTEWYGDYCWGEGFSAAPLRLKEGGEVWLILPDEGVTPEELLGDTEAMRFLLNNSDWEDRKSIRINYTVPKFDVDAEISLVDGLRALGLSDVFSAERADFTPLTGSDAYLSEINHGVRVKVDEEGIEAAAYTEMMLAGSAMPPEEEIDFTVDRPFLFAVQSADGTPLFTGIVNTIRN